MFLKVTSTLGHTFYVNADHIRCIYGDSRGGSVLSMTVGDKLALKEPPDDLVRRLTNPLPTTT
jgi:uncharacterized protein YlzI (FlbEa/FlbD family)